MENARLSKPGFDFNGNPLHKTLKGSTRVVYNGQEFTAGNIGSGRVELLKGFVCISEVQLVEEIKPALDQDKYQLHQKMQAVAYGDHYRVILESLGKLFSMRQCAAQDYLENGRLENHLELYNYINDEIKKALLL